MADNRSDDRASPGKARPVYVPDFVRPERRPLILFAAILASAMGFIDGTVVSIAMPAIRESLGATLGEATWINNGYMVTLAALILAGGAFGDRFGLGRVFSLGIGLFIVTSLICALAPSPDILILARLAQGIGAALMVPGSLAIVSRAYPREIRGRAIGLWAGASAFTTALGPVIGGLALTLGGPEMWRFIFAINLPLGLIALWLVRRGIDRDTARPGAPIDLPGAVLATLGLGALAWALAHAEGGHVSPAALWVAGAGAGILAAFLWREHRTSAPMMPLGLFRSATFSAANAATFALYFGLSAILFYLPMLVIAGWGVSEIETTFAFAPIAGFIALLSTRFGRLADRIGPGPVIAGGAFLVATAYLWLSFSVATRAFWTGVLPPMMLLGFGMAMVVAPVSTAVMAAVRDDQTGVASGVNNAMARIAGLIAVAAMGSVAALVYASQGGLASYGIASTTEGHDAAMTAAFATIARIAAGLAAFGALLAALAIRLPPAPEPPAEPQTGA